MTLAGTCRCYFRRLWRFELRPAAPAFGQRRIRISARRRLRPFSIEPDIDGLGVEKNLTLQQPRLLDILIPGSQKSQGAALRQKDHKVFRAVPPLPP